MASYDVASDKSQALVPAPAAAARRVRVPHQGEAVQVDPIKITLKAPGTKRLKLQYYEPPSNFAFNFNLRSYIKDQAKTLRVPAYQLWCTLLFHALPR
jgi:hypothetical protein